MAQLVVDLGERPEAVRVDLVALGGDLGVAAVTDVPPGPHRVSVLLAGGWQHQWVFVDPGQTGVRQGLAPEAIVALPPDGGSWSALTAHLGSRDALFSEWVEPEDEYDVTRFQAVLEAYDGDASRVLALLERSFLEWTLPSDAPDDEAGRRWRTLLVAIAGAGPRGIEAEPQLLADAADVIAIQLAALPSDAIDESIHEALSDLRDDLAT